jgi:Protein of unknown function with HXXEE motif
MELNHLLWLATAAYAVHVLEEFVFDWRNWARIVLKLPVEWSTFYVTNAVVIVLGVVSAQVSGPFPTVALAFPALMLINATFFHVAPFLWTRGRFSPGLITAMALFYPMGIWCYRAAASVGVLTTGVLFGSIALGALVMATPILFLKASGLAYFKQDRPRV